LPPAIYGSRAFRVQDDEVVVSVAGSDPDLWADILLRLSLSSGRCPEGSPFSVVYNVK